MNERPLYTIGSFAIIFNEAGQVLLSHRRDIDAWNLPGGGLEQEELPTEGVVREVREETGLEVEVDRLVGIYGKIGRNELVFAYLCHVTGGSIKVTEESDECRYFAPERIPPNTLKKHVFRIYDAINNHSQPVIRKERANIRS